MTHANYFNFSENMFALLFLHSIEDNFGEQNQHKMKELSMSCE